MSNSFLYKECLDGLGEFGRLIKAFGVFRFRPHPKPLPIRLWSTVREHGVAEFVRRHFLTSNIMVLRQGKTQPPKIVGPRKSVEVCY